MPTEGKLGYLLWVVDLLAGKTGLLMRRLSL